MSMIKLKPIKKGSKIAVISPSAPLPNLFPDLYEMGLQNIEEILQIEIVEMPTARMDRKTLYENPMLRAKDINDAFEDDQIDGIICSIGGYESVRILEYLDLEIIMKNPKMIMGFSDATTFLSYLASKGMPTLHGPSVMAGLAQAKAFESTFTAHLKTFLTDLKCPYVYPSYSKITQGYKDWSCKETLGECLPFENNEGLKVLQGDKTLVGKLWGGNIEVLEFLKGTKFWPDEAFWDDKILFFETSEDKPTPFVVGCMLRNYATQGILNKIKGIVFSKPKDYTPEEIMELDEILLNIINIENNLSHLLVMTGGDLGHTDPKWILPYNCEIEIDPVNKRIVLVENPFTGLE